MSILNQFFLTNQKNCTTSVTSVDSFNCFFLNIFNKSKTNRAILIHKQITLFKYFFLVNYKRGETGAVVIMYQPN